MNDRLRELMLSPRDEKAMSKLLESLPAYTFAIPMHLRRLLRKAELAGLAKCTYVIDRDAFHWSRID